MSVTIAAGAALVPLIIVAFQDYRYYVSLGPHGLPDNFYGWYKQLRMSTKARKDTTVPVPYDFTKTAKANGPHSDKCFFSEPLKTRAGPRPGVCGFVAPQRQTSEIASGKMKKEMNAYLDALVRGNPTVFQRELSYLEGPVPAVQLRYDVEHPSFLKSTKGELIHIHPPDGSTHIVLSLTDSAKVIEQGWGQRHRLSGGLLTWGYTLIYAPRNEEEFAVWKKIVAAAARFSTTEFADIRVPDSC
ncbi:hypothetical protein BJ170DRAFT_673677 [Xylariales sp. AK1849]|nr:hypothetical protein BJ170DRAFT_673677 [Xylariales sp. AK1849]